jgi:hypothetical protein
MFLSKMTGSASKEKQDPRILVGFFVKSIEDGMTILGTGLLLCVYELEFSMAA